MLQSMLNLNPLLKNELQCYNDDAVKGLLQIHANEVVGVKHPFVGLKDKVAYPLYKLLCLQPSLQVVTLCHQAYPNAIQVTADYQRLPLHAACIHGANLDTIKYLVEQYPASVDTKDNQGHVPIHHAIMNQADGKVQKYLLQCIHKDQVDCHVTILLLCLEHKSSKSVVKSLLHINRDVFLTIQDEEGTLLHKALLLGANRDIIKLLLKTYPDLVSTADAEGWLPLHSSVGSNHNQASTDVVQCLLQAYPEALTKTTNLGRSPLLLALRYDAPFETIEILCNDETAQLPDRDAHYPLHFACRAQSRVRVICLLLKTFPQATKMEDLRGMLPIHFCCKYHTTEIEKIECDPQVKIKVIQILVKADPESLFHRDDDGYSPLDMACLDDGAIPPKARRYMALQNGRLAKKQRLDDMVFGTAIRGGPPLQIMFSPRKQVSVGSVADSQEGED